MKANDVIEAYVTDVAAHLPRSQRNDVAYELRALLSEELAGKAEAAGRAADEELATALVRAFGRPADVAARYRPTLTIIAPEDGHSFLRAASVGLVIIWVLGLFTVLRQPFGTGWDILTPLGKWWTGVVIPSLWWPGVLVVGYGMAARARLRPRPVAWSPRGGERGEPSRAGVVFAVLAILFGVFVLTDPRWVVDTFFGAQAAPELVQALTYTPAFQRWKAPAIVVLLALNIPILLTVLANRGWTPTVRRFEQGLATVTCVALVWIARGGPVFMSTGSDQVCKGIVSLIVLFMLIGLGVSFSRRVRPAPDRELAG